MTPARRLVAYVLPVHNEAAGIVAFHEALITATDKRPDLDFEFVYVDDGSRDESLDLLLELREADQRVTVIALARELRAPDRGDGRARRRRRRATRS